MEYQTFGTLNTKVKKALGMESEDFISSQEWIDYFNEAVDQCESLIHTLYEDYFLKRAVINLVSGTKEYSLPSDIFANKVRAVIFKDGDDIYALRRYGIRNDKFLDLECDDIEENKNYEYILINESSSIGVQIKIIPTPLNTSNETMVIWYIRNAQKYTLDTDVCDIPEFTDFITQYVKVRAYEKEGNDNLATAAVILGNIKENMVNTLSSMVPDEDNKIEADLSHYIESN